MKNVPTAVFWFTASLLLVAPAGWCGDVPQDTAAKAKAYKDTAFTESFRRTSGWTAGDVATSVPLSDGRVLWLFGDSHADDIDAATETMACLFQARNAGLVSDTNGLQAAQTMLGSGPGFKSWFVNPVDTNVWFWPACGFQQADNVYVYLSALRKTAEGGMWGFERTGKDWWAKIKYPELKIVAYTELPSFGGIQFGSGFVEDNGFTYAYGGKREGLASDLFVARFASQNPEGPWSFWDGRQWSADATGARAIGRGTSSSLHVCRIRNKFLLTTSGFSVACDQSRDIFMSTSSNPEGPFSVRKKIFAIDDTYRGHFPFFYLPIAHPEYLNAQNELLVTYCVNGYEPCISSCVNGRSIPDHYRPKAIRVPLTAIDPDWSGAP